MVTCLLTLTNALYSGDWGKQRILLIHIRFIYFSKAVIINYTALGLCLQNPSASFLCSQTLHASWCCEQWDIHLWPISFPSIWLVPFELRKWPHHFRGSGSQWAAVFNFALCQTPAPVLLHLHVINKIQWRCRCPEILMGEVTKS